MAERNVVDLKRNVNDTYKNERNYAIKRTKLEKYLNQIAGISRLVKETENLLDDEHATFSNFAPDEQLVYIIIDVRTQLKAAFHSLIDLEKTIRDYLHQIDAIGKLVAVLLTIVRHSKPDFIEMPLLNQLPLTASLNINTVFT